MADPSIPIATWAQFADAHLVGPAIVQLAITGLLLLARPCFYLLERRSNRLKTFIGKFIGTTAEPRVSHPTFLVLISTCQVTLSCMSVFQWQKNVYDQHKPERWTPVEKGCNGFFVFYYLVKRFQAGFEIGDAWRLGPLIDVVTIVPNLGQIKSGLWGDYLLIARHHRWLNLDYLRAYRALTAYEGVSKAGNATDFSDIPDDWVSFAYFLIKLFALVVCMGGTVFVMEVLGPFPGWEDQYIATNMGPLSAVQMFYWIVETMSTVGYGDFSPTTVPSRLATIVFIFVGIIFFGKEVEAMMALRAEDAQGKGRYIRPNKFRQHVVVVGNGVNKHSSFVEAFLFELILTGGPQERPDVVLLAEKPYDKEMLALCEQYPQLKLFSGSPMSPTDLERVLIKKSRMVYILPDLSAPVAETEDGKNILRAIHLQQYFPDIRFRLMLLEPESKIHAVTMGIELMRCFVADVLKSNIFVHAIRVRGFITFLASLTQKVLPEDIRNVRKHAATQGGMDWMPEYLDGLSHTLRGFSMGEILNNKTFAEASVYMYEQSDGSVLLVAAQHEGKLLLNFNGKLLRGMVGMAICESRQDLSAFEDTSADKQDWVTKFIHDRRAARQHADDLDSLGGKGHQRYSTEFTKLKQVRLMSMKGEEDGNESDPDFEHVGNEFALNLLEHVETGDATVLHKPGKIVLVVMCEKTWQLVASFLVTLRSDFLPFWQPVLVMSRTRPPILLAKAYTKMKVEFLVGPFDQVRNIIAAGVLQAHTLVLFRESAEAVADSDYDHILGDHDNVVLASLFEQLIVMESSKCFTICEFSNTVSVHLVAHHHEVACTQKLISAAANQADASAGTRGSSQSTDKIRRSLSTSGRGSMNSTSDRASTSLVMRVQSESLVYNISWFCSLLGKNIRRLLIGGGDNSTGGLQKLIFQPRFAAGQVFTYDVLGSLLGRIYRFPGTIEFVEALTMPARRHQTSIMFQVSCPQEWVGQTFGEIVKSWLLENDSKLAGCGPVLPVAIYRTMGSGVAVQSYKICSPPPSTKLAKTDLLTVLASPEFGRAMHALGILQGVEADEDPAP